MSLRRLIVMVPIVFLFVMAGNGSAQDRAILYSKGVTTKMEWSVQPLRFSTSPRVPYDKLVRTTDYFVRIAPRRFILTEKNEVQESAVLSTKPLVFVTTPESIRGRTLLEIYEDIGYEAADIIRWQRDEDMVAVVFRFPDPITVAPTQDGNLPADWNKKVFVPTWANIFTLFTKLAERAAIDPTRKIGDEFSPVRTFFRSEAERQFVLSYPSDGRRRIQAISYDGLKATGGADWTYRKLLEEKLSLFAHFRGTGLTQNVVLDPDNLHPEAGLLEFVGPNTKVMDLTEVAIVHLGRLVIDTSTQPLVKGK